MRTLAAWVTARFYRGPLIVTALFLLPPGIVLAASAVVLTSLVRGLRDGAAVTGLSVALLGTLTALAGQDGWANAAYAGVALGIAYAASWLVVATRSLTLTVQISAILLVAGVALCYVLIDNPVGLWARSLQGASAELSASGLAAESERIVAMAAPIMTGLAGGLAWLAVMLALFLGYGGYTLVSGGKARYGRFRDLNLGRVLAGAAALLSVVATLTGSPALVNMALALLVAFWVQGLALLHGVADRRQWPPIALVTVYLVLLLPTPIMGLAAMVLSVTGYVDAWIGFRERLDAGPA